MNSLYLLSALLLNRVKLLSVRLLKVLGVLLDSNLERSGLFGQSDSCLLGSLCLICVVPAALDLIPHQGTVLALVSLGLDPDRLQHLLVLDRVLLQFGVVRLHPIHLSQYLLSRPFLTSNVLLKLFYLLILHTRLLYRLL